MRSNLCALLLTGAVLVMAPTRAESGEQRDAVLTLGGGTQVPLTVIVPEGYTEEIDYPMVLALPGGQGTPPLVRSFLANYWTGEADRRETILIGAAIQGRSLESLGYDFLESLFEWADVHLSYDPARVTLAGQSNGGLGAFHLARLAPERFVSLIVMPGGYAGEMDQLSGKPVLLLVGERDADWVQLARTTRDFLVLAGATPRLQLVAGGGHVFAYPGRLLYDWIQLQYPE